MYSHTKFGIPTSKNIGDMDRTRKRDRRTDGLTDGQTDGGTVQLLYASQSSFGGIKINTLKLTGHASHKDLSTIQINRMGHVYFSLPPSDVCCLSISYFVCLVSADPDIGDIDGK